MIHNSDKLSNLGSSPSLLLGLVLVSYESIQQGRSEEEQLPRVEIVPIRSAKMKGNISSFRQ